MTAVTDKRKQHTKEKNKKSSVASTSPTEESFSVMGYFTGVKQEWGKITWPGRGQVIAETAVVLVVVALFSVFVYLVDNGFRILFSWIT